MATRAVDHLLVGGGIASATCASELRALGAGGSILVVGREPDDPYHRPPVTKGYLRGEETRDDAMALPAGWWRDHDVELATGTEVVELDPNARSARMSDGTTVRFGQALLATGATARRIAVPGSDLAGIHGLRTLRDVEALRVTLAEAERIVLVGGSYVACEVAASLTALGRRCTIVMREPVPFAPAFGHAAGRFLGGVLTAHGVGVVTQDEVERFDGTAGRVRAVTTVRGRRLEADAVIAGIGSEPDVTLALRAGLKLGRTGGVRCDALLRSSHPAVLCAGDVCEYESVVHGRPVRAEYENAAMEQGRTAAQVMLGERRLHTAVPYSSCDLADWVSLEYVGPATTWDEEVVRGSVDDGEFSVWYLNDAQVVAALMVERPADLEPACGLIASRADLTDRRHLLTDPGADLTPLTGVAM
jgi:3-phenylpropionate/trans-cinnamate dioxygenase ferredoxin reductase subunit